METTHITYVKIINTNLQISYLSTVQIFLVSGGTEKQHVLCLFMYTGLINSLPKQNITRSYDADSV